MDHWTHELEGLAAIFRAGETEIAKAFFSNKRTLNEHAAWLRFQVAREARNLEEIASHKGGLRCSR